MKRQIGKLAIEGCCLFLIASCSLEEEYPGSFEQDPSAIQIEALVGKSSLASTRISGDGTVWTAGDYIHVREASTGKTVEYRYTTDRWTPTGNDYLRWEGGSLPGAQTTFNAWYPQDATSHTDFMLPHATDGVADQSTSALLMQADWMIAHQVVTPGDAKVPLTLKFERRMAKVSVRVLANSEFFNGGKIEDFRLHSAHSKMEGNVGDNSGIAVYPLAKDKDGTVQTDKTASLSFSKTEGPTYTVIIFPTEKTENKDFITLKAVSNDGTTSQELVLTDTPELKPGCFYTFTLKTGKTRLEIVSVSVEDWEDGTLIGGNEGEAVKWDYIGAIKDVGSTRYENAYFWDVTDEDMSETLNCRYIYMPYILSIESFSANASEYVEKITALICTTLENSAFVGWTNLKEVNFPKAIDIGATTFGNCTNLSTVNMPKVQKLEKNNFIRCASLEKIILPAVTLVGTTSFQNCTKLTYVELPSAEEVRTKAFKECHLNTLILGTIHNKDLTVVPKDDGAETMTSGCTLILGIGSSGEGATSGDTASSDFQLSTASGYESLYSWAGLPWKEIIIKNATGEIVRTYPEKNNN